MRSRISVFIIASLFAAAPAFAAFHLIKVKEVFAGSDAHPNAQYVLVQAYMPNQNAVTGHSVLTFDATGTPTGTFTFTGGVPNGADQMTILIATPDAAAIFNLTADLAMTSALSPAGGKVCWEGSTPDDCFAWGNYTGSASGVGTPYNGAVGLIPGYAARRRLDICLGIQDLDACDDTDDGEHDFNTVVPDPITNPGVHGTTPPSTCGNGTLEGLEGCDDSNTIAGDGCSAVCHPEPAPLAPSALKVDSTEPMPRQSNINGVFEPDEAARFEPSWSNGGLGETAVTGEITNLTGPGPARYLIQDGDTGYGTIAPAATAACGTDCYYMLIDTTPSGGVRPVQHWDATVDEIVSNGGLKTWTLHLGNSFLDVPADIPVPHPFYAFIENLFHNGITGGCAGGNYCPANPVTRAQMAVFLLKAKLGASHVPPPCAGTVFADVPCTGGPFDPWIEELASLEITGGCGGANYCPDSTVTRQQMAVFLLKALLGSAYVPPLCAGDFDDVPCPGTFTNWIEDLYGRGITGGCQANPPLYCPTSPNNRGQMAVFLVKTFGLLLYGP